MVDLADARAVAVLTRAPSSGGKSRLFAALGRPADPALLTALLLDTIDGLRGAPGILPIVAVEPPSSCDEVRRIVPSGTVVVPQPGGSLGERMRTVMSELLAGGARAAVVVGSDLPEIEAHVVTEALALIEDDPEGLVLGPAADGGYYLIGAAHVPEVFDGISWGTDRVFAETVAAAERKSMRVRRLRPLGDIDTPADLDRIARNATGRGVRTIEWVRANRIGQARTLHG